MKIHRALAVATVLFLPAWVEGAVAHVQTTGGSSASVPASTAFRVTTGTTTGGNAIVVTICNYTGSGSNTTFTIADEFSNTWAQVTGARAGTDGGTGGTIDMFVALNLIGGATHWVDITPTQESIMVAFVTELSGVATSSAQDGGNAAIGTTGAAVSGNITTTNAADGLVSGGLDTTTTTNFTAGTDWIEQAEVDETTGGTTGSVATRIVASAATYSHTWGGKPNPDDWGANIGALKAAAGAAACANYIALLGAGCR